MHIFLGYFSISSEERSSICSWYLHNTATYTKIIHTVKHQYIVTLFLLVSKLSLYYLVRKFEEELIACWIIILFKIRAGYSLKYKPPSDSSVFSFFCSSSVVSHGHLGCCFCPSHILKFNHKKIYISNSFQFYWDYWQHFKQAEWHEFLAQDCVIHHTWGNTVLGTVLLVRAQAQKQSL